MGVLAAPGAVSRVPLRDRLRASAPYAIRSPIRRIHVRNRDRSVRIAGIQSCGVDASAYS